MLTRLTKRTVTREDYQPGFTVMRVTTRQHGRLLLTELSVKKWVYCLNKIINSDLMSSHPSVSIL